MDKMDRPNRNATKLTRCQTTSSDEEPSAKWARSSTSRRLPSSSPSPSSSTQLKLPSIEGLLETLAGVVSEAANAAHPPPTLSFPRTYVQLPPAPIPASLTLTHPPPTLPSSSAALERMEQMLLQILQGQKDLQRQEAEHLAEVRKFNQVVYDLLEKQTELQRQQKTIVEKLEAQRRALFCEQRGEEPPHFLPLKSLEEVLSFEKITDEEYESVVVYFAHLGGYTAKEAVNKCFKEAVSDACASGCTWLGANGAKSLSDTRIVRAIYEATLRNTAFSRILEREFEKIMQNALKSAKERHRKDSGVHRIPSTTTSANLRHKRSCWRNTNISSNDDATTSGAGVETGHIEPPTAESAVARFTN